MEFQKFYEFLLVIYDMNHEKESYYWNARKIANTDEASNEAFVRLVAGMGTGVQFVRDRIGAGEWAEAVLFRDRHFYSVPSKAPAGAAEVAALNARFSKARVDYTRKGAPAASETESMVLGVPFPRLVVRPNDLIVSNDGLAWSEPAEVKSTKVPAHLWDSTSDFEMAEKYR